ncbi:MAG: transposase [Caldilineaceae bacterium SB0668_bin_21]|nr:transposase [Caldilineaceae bacterium SB0668_bin_21]MYC23148.1 transposase [Caldilineaceae bacterium SB0662_bin_25]
MKDGLLDREVVYTLLEVRVLTERYRRTYNHPRPHSSPGYRPPAPEALLSAGPVPVLDPDLCCAGQPLAQPFNDGARDIFPF